MAPPQLKVHSAAKYVGCIVIGGAIGFCLGDRDSAHTPNGTTTGQRPAPPVIGRPMVKNSRGKNSAQPESWSGDIYSAGLGEGALTARLQKAVDIGEPFTVALLVQLVGKMSAEEAPEVFKFLRAHKEADAGSNHNGPPVWIAFWMAWGGIAPEAALAQIEADLPPYPMNDRALSHVFGGLAMRDLEKAKALALAQSNESSLGWATEATTYRWAEKDPKAAAEWAMTLEDPYRSRAFSAIPWAIDQRQGPAQAIGWLQSMEPEASGAQAAFGSLVAVFTGRSSKVAAEDRVALLAEASARNLRSQALEVAIATDYSGRDPLKGISLLGALPPIPGREPYAAISTLVSGWAQTDAEGAGNWLLQQRGQAWGDAAIRGYINAIKTADPEAAIKWQQTLQSRRSP